MKTMSWLLLLTAFCFAAPLSAQLKGKAAPDFKAGESITSPIEHQTLSECKAEVVLIKLWGIK